MLTRLSYSDCPTYSSGRPTPWLAKFEMVQRLRSNFYAMMSSWLAKKLDVEPDKSFLKAGESDFEVGATRGHDGSRPGLRCPVGSIHVMNGLEGSVWRIVISARRALSDDNAVFTHRPNRWLESRATVRDKGTHRATMPGMMRAGLKAGPRG